ncbi:MAG TPA: sugar transferase [Gemmatimonadaceae bacterium]|nr:sugar transferase [Gemmatimonadaceae bacterium]
MKRAIDFTAAAVLIAVASPLLILLAALVRLQLGRPILFKQLRPGLHGTPFTLIKFRTMHDRFDANGTLLPDQLRLSRFGNFLRSTSLDELPELYNVLKGDMSFVGPRPLLMEYLSLYSPVQARRHLVRPGITGLAQVSGRNMLDWPERFALDVAYVDNVSLKLDLLILMRTAKRVLTRHGVNPVGASVTPRFRGTS